MHSHSKSLNAYQELEFQDWAKFETQLLILGKILKQCIFSIWQQSISPLSTGLFPLHNLPLKIFLSIDLELC